jgi:hypothetical protein
MTRPSVWAARSVLRIAARAGRSLHEQTSLRLTRVSSQRWIVVRMLGSRASHYWCGPYRSDGQAFTRELGRAYVFASERAAECAITGCLVDGPLEVRRVE